MGNYINDVRDFGAVGDGITNDTTAFRLAAQHAEANGGKVVAVGRFLLSGYVTFTTDCDFSQATLVIDTAKIAIAYPKAYLDQNERVITSLDKSKLRNLQSSLGGVLDSATIKAYENAFVRISSDGDNSIYIYRDPATSPTSPQKKNTVSLMNKYGRLTYSISHDYTNVANVTITLRKLPPKRLTFICPTFEIKKYPEDNFLFRVTRDLVNVVDFTLNHDAPEPDDVTYFAMIGCSNCYDVVLSNTSTPGYGTTNSEPGTREKVRYDIMLDRALKLTIDNLDSTTGWKTLDGNHSRDIRVLNSNLYGIHGHFNVADVTVSNCRIETGGISIGTGALDASLTVRDCVFTSRFGRAVSMRPDYGELRGRVVIENCRLEMSSLTDASREVVILTLVDSAIRNADQPNIYSLPSSIVIRDVFVHCQNGCSIINLNNGAMYNEKRRLNGPQDITIENIRVQSSTQTDLHFVYRFVPYNFIQARPVSISLRNIENKDGGVSVKLWVSPENQANKLQYEIDMDNIKNLHTLMLAGRKSTVRMRNCSVRSLDTYNRDPSWLKQLAISNCTFLFNEHFDSSNSLILSHTVQSLHISNCIFDASEYRAAKQLPLPIAAWVHVSNGCMSIDCYGTGDDKPPQGLKTLVPKRGSDTCYRTRPDGTLELMP